MNEGYWMNYKTGNYFKIDEHERWIRDIHNAKKLGISQQLIDKFDDYTSAKDRNEFLTMLMKNAPIMRIRGHGSYTTFEYNSSKDSMVMDSIYEFTKQMGFGPFSYLNIVNLKTMKSIEKSSDEFSKTFDDIRLAKIAQFLKVRLAV